MLAAKLYYRFVFFRLINASTTCFHSFISFIQWYIKLTFDLWPVSLSMCNLQWLINKGMWLGIYLCEWWYNASAGSDVHFFSDGTHPFWNCMLSRFIINPAYRVLYFLVLSSYISSLFWLLKWPIFLWCMVIFWHGEANTLINEWQCGIPAKREFVNRHTQDFLWRATQ